MKVTVLMSVYYRENPLYLEECLESLKVQTLPPSEIVIVEDGPLTEQLYQVLDLWGTILPIRRVKLEINSGLGVALNRGLEACENELVARMDTDDVCHPSRIEKQVEVFTQSNVDICGSWISEFEQNCDIIASFRKTPRSHDEIVRFSHLKNPMNHPSVMYKKSVVMGVGGYDDVLFFEDYHLWLKLIDNGARFYNLEEVLVYMRAGLSQLSRRSGKSYALSELRFFRKIKSDGLLSSFQVLVGILTRVPLRLLPKKYLAILYRKLRES